MRLTADILLQLAFVPGTVGCTADIMNLKEVMSTTAFLDALKSHRNFNAPARCHRESSLPTKMISRIILLLPYPNKP